jgi:hypothetical protein
MLGLVQLLSLHVAGALLIPKDEMYEEQEELNGELPINT